LDDVGPTCWLCLLSVTRRLINYDESCEYQYEISEPNTATRNRHLYIYIYSNLLMYFKLILKAFFVHVNNGLAQTKVE
jgi:hypothetical protein